MLLMTLKKGNRTVKFYTFTQIGNFLRDELLTKEEQDRIAKKAIKLLDSSHLEFDLLNYYRSMFKAYLIPVPC